MNAEDHNASAGASILMRNVNQNSTTSERQNPTYDKDKILTVITLN